MGRTNPTFRDELDALRGDWEDYRRCLRRSDQERFDSLFDSARGHADACSHLNPHDPMPAVLFSMLLEQQRRIEEIERRLEDGEGGGGEDDVVSDATSNAVSDASSGEPPEEVELKGTPGLEDS